jgi:hypothetical protein
VVLENVSHLKPGAVVQQLSRTLAS